MSEPSWANRIFVFWTGDNPMSEARADCLRTIEANSGCEVVLVTPANLDTFIVPGSPLHPAYPYLSLNHRSDYLRAYFMDHHGGGYSDVKRIFESWRPAFDAVEKSNAWGAGYQELRGGVADLRQSHVGGTYYMAGVKKSSRLLNTAMYWTMKVFHKRMIGNGCFLFRPQTDFTAVWLREVERRLDDLLPLLEKNPSRHLKEGRGRVYDGIPSQYPVPWAFLQGEVMAVLSFVHHRRILQTVPVPSFTDYE